VEIEKFYSFQSEKVTFTRQQASLFAKEVAGDFNPLHDENAKRFCVPGDLLFAVTLSKLGVSQNMRFDFEGMVTESSELDFTDQGQGKIDINDQNDKVLMHIHHSGENTTEQRFVSSLIEKYVAFSGRTFPEVLVALMKKNQVMINTSRPLVIYKNMAVHIDEFPIGDLSLEFTGASFQAEGKKGTVNLEFDLLVNGRTIGHGTKSLVLGGLREYDQAAIDSVVLGYENIKKGYFNK